ncbi:RagB/SusD family nutrient uptake outer membrane protein [Chitinophaga flava]|uniref:RagB/SusD family nutrient uptake outer membrane protein n=1 Tax=Chitinophaga flava TaxID=2259036 RepID=A0A365XZ65_9BACT|nr:RagB/SusD family nutrient uptake outer membrane protein [Chitinophaga flava]RBL90875.1 RagB/SusD family nutrient uptake outer membrane protein [Chitinophaga flava]
MRYKILITLVLIAGLSSCSKYLDVVPDNVPTIDNAFTLRTSAEKYLFTCYSYMPKNGHFNDNVAFNGGDEVWYDDPIRDVDPTFFNIAKGLQSMTSPLANYWSGSARGTSLFVGIRDCNTFLANIGKVRELRQYERERWIAEVKFLKAYYHFFLFRCYGPVPLIKENLPVSAGSDEVQIYRQPVDTCINYIVKLLDEAASSEFLPNKLEGTENTELGRITKCIVLSLKAKVLVTAASPFFNGNPDYSRMVDNRGVQLFPTSYNAEKWSRAALACKEAIEFCQANGYTLYHFPGNFGYKINDTLQTQLDIRAAMTDKQNNTEVIWPNTNSTAGDMQRWSMPLIANGASTSGPKGIIAPTLKMVEMFYSKNGVPITEDRTWDYSRRYVLRTATNTEKYYVRSGEQTVELHFDREPRFYADVAFDRAVWFGNWVLNYNKDSALYFVKGRATEIASRRGISNYSVTGYWVKKTVNIESSAATDGNIASGLVTYPWPEIRLADLYLLYSEALNEVNGPGAGTTQWINLVRARAGLKSVEESWTNYSKNPTKYTTKEGMREIIQQERAIELCFEGQRFWDLRRWKTAHVALNNPIKGWDITQNAAPSYYKEVLLFNQRFGMRDYLWPIENAEMIINKNLVQNPGW